MIKFSRPFLLILILSVTLILVFNNILVKAEEPAGLGGLENTANGIGYKQEKGSATELIDIKIGTVINIVFSLLGVIFFVIIWIGGLDIIGANGNEELVKKGKDRIVNGAIGILIVLIAYLFTKAIIGIIQNAGQF